MDECGVMISRGKSKNLENILLQCPFVHHESPEVTQVTVVRSQHIAA
jgi:hypothetical protein